MKTTLAFMLSGLFMASLSSCVGRGTEDSNPAWLEADSAEAMYQRKLKDFPMTYLEGASRLMLDYPHITLDSVREYVNRHYIETMTIDGQERMFRKASRNLGLLNPAFNCGWKHRGWNASEQRHAYADSVIRYKAGTLPEGGARRAHIRFTLDVPYHPALKGDTLRVWMPYPREVERLGDIELLSTSQPAYVISAPEQSVHSTIYMEAPVVEGDTAHFAYEAEFTMRGEYFSPEYIQKNIKPYDTESEIYNRYTRFDGPHYVRLDSLARSIVGDETNPYLQSELVYDYIIEKYPWAGAREYSTIPSLPLYVIEEGHGDCGQVALLYISLMRTLGVPARWESGWMLHPGECGWHDWAEAYFEGIGWVPVDVSFGRYTSSSDPAVQKFYSTGIDAYRFVSNQGVGEPFFPAKRYIRSETVDSQAGEVECSRGNLFYPAWDSNLEIISILPQ